MLDMTPHFTVRVWGNPDRELMSWNSLLGRPPVPPILIAEIEIDTTDFPGTLTITGHRGLDFIPQKMLPPVPEQPTLWHQV